MASYPLVLGITLIAILSLSVIVMAMTGSFTAVLVVFTLAGVILYILHLYGYFNISITNSGIDINFMETAPPAPAAQIVPTARPISQSEVFYVSGNNYTYDEAPAVCAAYEADLATYDQVNEAYSLGAEWCGYGWTQGGMALFPTQETTWEALQGEVDVSKRTSCGRPGINGGYFDPSTKFGVNCYGVKPKNTTTFKFPLPLPGTDSGKFNHMVNKYKSMINKMVVSPFNRDGWSEWNLSSHTGGPAQKGGVVSDIEQDLSAAGSDISSYWNSFTQEVRSAF